MRDLIRAIYAVFAAGLLGLGVIAFLLPYGLLPEVAAGLSDEALHITQEAGAAVIALAVLCAACAWRYESSSLGHSILTLFFVLIAVIHWADYLREMREISSPVLTSLPAIVFIALGFLRRRAEAGS